ncbi:MAG: IS110 family transposase, partial [Acidobacteria bacterium]|nr:IS110 family transposase [Acidobacteriota bacterium]
RGEVLERGEIVEERRVAAVDLFHAQERFGVVGGQVVSCYEAGRDGFWLHRWLGEQGVKSLVIDASSTQVDRRQRRAKTDRLDLRKLLWHLARYQRRERGVWRVVQVPSEEAEDERHLHRELERLTRDRVRVGLRIGSLLATQGVKLKVKAGLMEGLVKARVMGSGRALGEGLRWVVEMEFRHWEFLSAQIRELKGKRRELLARSQSAGAAKARRMQELFSVGEEISWSFAHEGFAFRQFRNRREVAGYVGLTPTPYASGRMMREQGISKAGNRRLRWLAVQWAWMWLRLQPESELSRWYQERFAKGNARHRRVGIVALARKLVVALWRWSEYGEVPAGARLRAPRAA